MDHQNEKYNFPDHIFEIVYQLKYKYFFIIM